MPLKIFFSISLSITACQSLSSFPTVIPTTEEPGRGVRGFTRDPSQLKGSILQTALRKSPQGFGFTIIGGDRPDEFLQVKNVLPDGPAAHDNKIASGNLPSQTYCLSKCTAVSGLHFGSVVTGHPTRPQCKVTQGGITRKKSYEETNRLLLLV